MNARNTVSEAAPSIFQDMVIESIAHPLAPTLTHTTHTRIHERTSSGNGGELIYRQITSNNPPGSNSFRKHRLRMIRGQGKGGDEELIMRGHRWRNADTDRPAMEGEEFSIMSVICFVILELHLFQQNILWPNSLCIAMWYLIRFITAILSSAATVMARKIYRTEQQGYSLLHSVNCNDNFIGEFVSGKE